VSDPLAGDDEAQAARTSPAVQRVAAVLNFFAEHVDQTFSLTEVVRSLRISRATCHTLLTGLVQVGYLHRVADRRYAVGPVLVSAARAIAQSHSPLQVARPEMRALADAFDAVCSIVVREGHEAVVVERATSVSNLGWTPPAGLRLPLRAPFGAVFYAWSPKPEVDAWLDVMTPSPSAADRARTFEAMRFAREAGFNFGCYAPGPAAARQDVGWIDRGEMADPPVVVQTALDEARLYDASFVAAPVFEADQRIAFEVVLSLSLGEITGAEVARIAARLRAVCDRIGAFVAAPPAA
jgi:DNA-binding IclR family transcriptional regulator